MRVHVLQEPPNLLIGIMIVTIFRQINLLLFDGANEPLGITVLGRRSRRITGWPADKSAGNWAVIVSNQMKMLPSENSSFN